MVSGPSPLASLLSPILILLLCSPIPGNLRFERALLHLVILVLQALPQLLEALLPILVPLDMPLIGRALLPLVMVAVSMRLLRFLQLGKIVVPSVVAHGGRGRVRVPVLGIDLGRLVQVAIEVVERGHLEGLWGTGQDLRGLCIVVWQASRLYSMK